MPATLRRRRSVVLGTVVLAAVALAGSGRAAVSGAVASADTTRVLSARVGPETTAPSGITPAQIRSAYGFDTLGKDKTGSPIDGRGQIVAVILYGDDASSATDLGTFDSQFKLPAMDGTPGNPTCTVSRTVHVIPCFERVYASGKKPAAETAKIEGEAALDVQWAHVAAEGADILFVEAANGSASAELTAIDKAVSLGASVVSMSFVNIAMTSADNSHFEVTTAGFVSGSGDEGCPEAKSYPAESSYVLAVGGTVLEPGAAASTQVAWASSGGGINTTEPRPGYQMSWTSSSSGRTYDDVSYNAVGYPTYVALPKPGWSEADGVSAGIPQWAGIVALADQERASLGKSVLASSGLLSGIYLAAASHESKQDVVDPAMFTDVSNGHAGSSPDCYADKGYDETTGLGTPKVAALVTELGDL